MNIAVILAGGSGTRLGGALPKQFLQAAGKTLLEHSIEAFERHPGIDEIAVVIRKDFIAEVEAIVQRNRYQKVRKILPGGKERHDSSLAAIRAYTDDNDRLLLHDAVRPLVSQRIISDCLAALCNYRAVAVAVKTTDTIYQVDEEGCIRAIPPRSTLRNAQTPQGFSRGTISRAYRLALQDPLFTTTDDCGVVSRYLPQEPIYVVEGEAGNIKVTFKEDLPLVERLLRER